MFLALLGFFQRFELLAHGVLALFGFDQFGRAFALPPGDGAVGFGEWNFRNKAQRIQRDLAHFFVGALIFNHAHERRLSGFVFHAPQRQHGESAHGRNRIAFEQFDERVVGGDEDVREMTGLGGERADFAVGIAQAFEKNRFRILPEFWNHGQLRKRFFAHLQIGIGEGHFLQRMNAVGIFFPSGGFDGHVAQFGARAGVGEQRQQRARRVGCADARQCPDRIIRRFDRAFCGGRLVDAGAQKLRQRGDRTFAERGEFARGVLRRDLFALLALLARFAMFALDLDLAVVQ